MNELETEDFGTDDPVAIAINAFNGNKLNQYYWRAYFIAMQILEKSVSKAADDFLEIIYTVQSEIKNDNIPNIYKKKDGTLITHFHAFLFQVRLKKIFFAKYGYVDFKKLLSVKTPNKRKIKK